MNNHIAYLGPHLSYSEKAAQLFSAQLNSEQNLHPYPSAQAVVQSLKKQDSKKIDLAVLPYYNYLDGLVQECLDLIYENRLYIIGSQRVSISLSIGKLKNFPARNTIYSHPKALAQCSEYLWNHHPNSKQIPKASTSNAANFIGSGKEGYAIANKEALLHYQLEICAEDIGNKRHGRKNFTDFYLLQSTEDQCPFDPRLTYYTMVVITPQVDREGLLSEILGQVAFYGLNNAKIHSRPAIDKVFIEVEPQMFYLEIMAYKEDEDFKRCVDALQYRLTPRGKNIEVVRVLGSYPKPQIN